MNTTVEAYERDEAEFRRVMNYATERAVAEGLEEQVKEALFDVLNGDLPDDEQD
jgi:hypothetical protein